MMNPAELKDLAAVLTGIADRKPWQMRSSENVEWGLASDCADPMDVIKAGFQIRLKPWELGRTINSHTLPDGAEWHRQDFPDGMLPAPYRPLRLGEERFGDDEVFGFTNKGPWIKCSELKSRFHDSDVGPKHNFSRTTRPIPFTLTKEQIADGWIPWAGGECPVEPESRPTVMFRNKETRDTKPAKDWVWHDSDGQWIIIAYRPDPYSHLRQALADGQVIQIGDSEGNWLDLASPSFDAPPDKYRIKEPQRVKLGPSDVPPGSVFRRSDLTEIAWFSITSVGQAGICLSRDSGPISWISWDLLEKKFLINRPRNRDADGNPTLWEECRKPVP